jgi:hypothetical protein
MAVAALRAGDTAEAARLCHERARFYDFLANRSYAGPYCAYAFLSEGQRSPAQAMLDRRLELGRKYLVRNDFNGRMLEALLQGFDGRADAALQTLEGASRRHGSFGASWMHEDHTLLAVAEWLGAILDDPRFSDLAVRTAQGRSAFMPDLAFYHGYVALHGADDSARIEAAGRASHLNPASYWLNQIPAETRDGGEQWLAREAPYDSDDDLWGQVLRWFAEL